MHAIYLDHNATTPVDPAVVEAMRPLHETAFGNPSSSHRFGRPAREALQAARARVAAALGAEPASIHFTSGGTGSDNLAILGRFAGRSAGRLVTTVVEHPAVADAAAFLEGRGIAVERLPVDGAGRIRLEDLERALERPADLVSVMLANNETGSLQPVAEAAAICRRRGVPMHTDAVNAAGKIPVEAGPLGVDALSLSAHKFHGPKGIGILMLRDRSLVEPLHHGGGQEGGLHPGTENVAGAVGLAEALALAVGALPEAGQRMGRLAGVLLERLRTFDPSIRLNVATAADRLPNTLSIIFPGRDGNDLLARLDERGVAVSAGAACHAGGDRPSGVLLAMGRTADEARSTLRISLGRTTTAAEIDRAAEVFREVLCP